MKAMDLTCPGCTAKLNVDKKKLPVVTCEYCDSSFILEGSTLKMRYAGYDETGKKVEIEELPPETDTYKRNMQHSNQKEVLNLEETLEDHKIAKRKKVLVASCLGALAFSYITDSSFFTTIFVVLLLACVVYLPKQTQRELNTRQLYERNGIRVSSKNKWVAFLLCLCLGFFGAHYFYTRRIGKGILYIFTLGLFGIGLIVDLIMILLGNFKDSTGAKLI